MFSEVIDFLNEKFCVLRVGGDTVPQMGHYLDAYQVLLGLLEYLVVWTGEEGEEKIVHLGVDPVDVFGLEFADSSDCL